MKYNIFKAQDFKTINWSGGTSTQLYIYPETANYQKRDFDFRISTAKVEVEKSDFTPLPGIERHLMILDGAIHISHKNHHEKRLNAFDQDFFMGDWETSSIGHCVDFNLMTRNHCKGELSVIQMLKNQEIKISETDQIDHLFLFIQKGEFQFSLREKVEILNEGSLLHICNEKEIDFSILCRQEGNIICSKVVL